MAASASIRSARSARSAVGGEGGELVAHAGQDVGPLRVDRRLVEPAEPDAAGQVADDREAQLGGAAEPLEQLRGPRPASSPGGGGSSIQRRSSGGGQRDLGRRALLGQEDPEDRLLQLGGALEVVDAVVAQHPQQPVAELLGQPAALDVEALQVGVEVLPRAVHPELGVPLLVGRAGCGSARRGRRRSPSSAISSATTATARRPAARRGRRGSPTSARVLVAPAATS